MRLVGWQIIVLGVLGWLTASYSVAQQKDAPTPPAQATAPPRWLPFRLDERLSVALPGPARQQDMSSLGGPHQLAAYYSVTPLTLMILVRATLPADYLNNTRQNGPEVLFTSLTQRILTQLGAVRTGQTNVRLGQQEGLAVRFRMQKPDNDLAGGTMWVFKVGSSVCYLSSMLRRNGGAAAYAEQTQFLASFETHDSPFAPPTPADLIRFRQGTFRYNNGLGIEQSTIIQRQDTSQIETNEEMGLRLLFGLRWTSNGYTLIRRRGSTGTKAQVLVGQPMEVEITGVQGNRYHYRASLLGVVFTGEIERTE